jgi:hypothetical protein
MRLLGSTSFIYEQVSEKHGRDNQRRQFSRKNQVKNSLTANVVLERGKLIQLNGYYILKTLGKVSSDLFGSFDNNMSIGSIRGSEIGHRGAYSRRVREQ